VRSETILRLHVLSAYLPLRQFSSQPTNADIEHAQRELDDFFGVQHVDRKCGAEPEHALQAARGLASSTPLRDEQQLNICRMEDRMSSVPRLTHVDPTGRATMVDVAEVRNRFANVHCIRQIY
jgi:hypothetical protein